MSSKYHPHQDMSYRHGKKIYIRVGAYGTDDIQILMSAEKDKIIAQDGIEFNSIEDAYEHYNKIWISRENKLITKGEKMESVKRDNDTVLVEITKEKSELDDKIEKLKRFTLSTAMTELNRNHINALHRQLTAMETYSLALRDRILDLGRKSNG